MTRRDSQWQLSDSALQQLLIRLDADPERAGERYEALRRTLLKYFEWRGALEPDTCADETLDRLARKLEQGAEVADLRAYAYGVARLIVLERARSMEAHHVTLQHTAKTLAAPDPTTETPMMPCLAVTERYGQRFRRSTWTTCSRCRLACCRFHGSSSSAESHPFRTRVPHDLFHTRVPHDGSVPHGGSTPWFRSRRLFCVPPSLEPSKELLEEQYPRRNVRVALNRRAALRAEPS